MNTGSDASTRASIAGANKANVFDVAILGTGISGTILGAILARNGVRTLLFEQSSHPRFAIGESTVPETTFLFRLLAARYDVPEIADLSTFNRIRRRVSTTCGVKRNFSFVRHRMGEPLRATETSQLPTLSPPLGPDVHLFRQDVDAYMLSVAASYGAVVRQRTDVTSVAMRAHGVELRTRAGTSFEAQYVVDAGGVQAPLARQFGLRHETPTLGTCSRSLYTHMQGVRPLDACMGSAKEHGLPSPLSQGTLHHLFDGGWMWVIPFNNHPSSTNRLTSVGLCLDPRRHPPTGLPPSEEWSQFIARYPTLQRQFADAIPIRDWVSTDRLQFTSERVVGDRFCLMPHAFAFVDPLFSSGLGIAMSAINGLAARLLQSKIDGDYSAARFAPIEERVQHNFQYFDRLVSRSYVAFSDFDVWNAWYKLWMLAGIYGSTGVLDVLGAYYRSGSKTAFDLCEQPPYDVMQASRAPMFVSAFDAGVREMDEYGAGHQSASETSRRILDAVVQSGMWVPAWGSVQNRHPGVFTVSRLAPAIAWFKRRAPEYLRRHYFNKFGFQDVARMAIGEWRAELGYAGGLVTRLARDFGTGYNDDWRSQS